MNADRKLNETRKAAYAGMGLCVKDAMTAHTPLADRIRTYAQEDGIDAWDLVSREYANGATGGTMVIVAFTPESGRQTAVIVNPEDSRDEIRAKFQQANGQAVTATGRPYRHAASPESMAKLKATVNPGTSEVSTRIAMTVLGYDQDSGSATGAIGGNKCSEGVRRYQLDKGTTGKPGDSIELVLHPDGSVTWIKA